MGVKNKDQNLACAFCGCNICQVICGALALVLVWWYKSLLDNIVANCNPATVDVCEVSGWSALCPEYSGSSRVTQTCYDVIAAEDHRIQALFFLTVCLSIPSFVISILAGFWGNQLYKELRKPQVIMNSPHFPVAHIMAQPSAQPLVQPLTLVESQPVAGGGQPSIQQVPGNHLA